MAFLERAEGSSHAQWTAVVPKRTVAPNCFACFGGVWFHAEEGVGVDRGGARGVEEEGDRRRGGGDWRRNRGCGEPVLVLGWAGMIGQALGWTLPGLM